MGDRSNWRWCFDEVFVEANGESHCLWRSVDREGGELEAYVIKRQYRNSALILHRKIKKLYGKSKNHNHFDQNTTSIHAAISHRTEPPLWLSGGSFVPHNFTVLSGN
ncbi:MAG: DDE-type integrase/transposase/recombinase [Paracoccaceae bacterium]